MTGAAAKGPASRFGQISERSDQMKQNLNSSEKRDEGGIRGSRLLVLSGMARG